VSFHAPSGGCQAEQDAGDQNQLQDGVKQAGRRADAPEDMDHVDAGTPEAGSPRRPWAL
jgi:hypothetical protein